MLVLFFLSTRLFNWMRSFEKDNFSEMLIISYVMSS